jgi:hypothetical protein
VARLIDAPVPTNTRSNRFTCKGTRRILDAAKGRRTLVRRPRPRHPPRRDARPPLANRVIVLSYTDDVARIWGQISAYAVRRGQPRPANDSWIAACTLTYGLPLAT